MTKLQMVGGGKMGQALLGGMLSSGWAQADELAVVDPDAHQRDRLAESFPGIHVLETPQAETATVLATKPHFVVEVAALLVRPTLVASVAAGITTAAIEHVVPAGTPVVRTMPNTPALVGVGASGIAPGRAASAEDVAWVQEMLGSVGEAVVVTEAQLDAVTGLSGSGPAYFFLIAEALADAGVTAGLTRPVAQALAHQTMAGAAAMLQQTGEDPAALRAGVTTPAGTTAAGLRTLEQHGVRSALIEAVAAATARSRELGQPS